MLMTGSVFFFNNYQMDIEPEREGTGRILKMVEILLNKRPRICHKIAIKMSSLYFSSIVKNGRKPQEWSSECLLG